MVKKPWEVILWDFVVKLLKLKDPITDQEYNTIFIIVDKFTKWEYFIVYIEEILTENVVQIYIKEVFTKYRVLDKIILDRDVRFIAAFWEVFIAKQGIKVVILIVYYP